MYKYKYLKYKSKFDLYNRGGCPADWTKDNIISFIDQDWNSFLKEICLKYNEFHTQRLYEVYLATKTLPRGWHYNLEPNDIYQLNNFKLDYGIIFNKVDPQIPMIHQRGKNSMLLHERDKGYPYFLGGLPNTSHFHETDGDGQRTKPNYIYTNKNPDKVLTISDIILSSEAKEIDDYINLPNNSSIMNNLKLSLLVIILNDYQEEYINNFLEHLNVDISNVILAENGIIVDTKIPVNITYIYLLKVIVQAINGKGSKYLLLINHLINVIITNFNTIANTGQAFINSKNWLMNFVNLLLGYRVGQNTPQRIPNYQDIPNDLWTDLFSNKQDIIEIINRQYESDKTNFNEKELAKQAQLKAEEVRRFAENTKYIKSGSNYLFNYQGANIEVPTKGKSPQSEFYKKNKLDINADSVDFDQNWNSIRTKWNYINGFLISKLVQNDNLDEKAKKKTNKMLLEEFYAKTNKEKVEKVDDILAVYSTGDLKRCIMKKYGSAPDLDDNEYLNKNGKMVYDTLKMHGFLDDYHVDNKYGPLKDKFVAHFTQNNQTKFINSLYSLDGIDNENQGKIKIINTIFNNIYNQLKSTLYLPDILKKLKTQEDFKTFQNALVKDSNIIFRNLFIRETVESRFGLYSKALPNDSKWNREIRNCNKDVLNLAFHPTTFRSNQNKPVNSHIPTLINKRTDKSGRGNRSSIGQTSYCNYLGYRYCNSKKKSHQLCEYPIFGKRWMKKLNEFIDLLKKKRPDGKWKSYEEMIDDILLALKIILYNIKLSIYGDNATSGLKVLTSYIGYHMITNDDISDNSLEDIIDELEDKYDDNYDNDNDNDDNDNDNDDNDNN